MEQVVGKSLALRRDVLESLGGWERFKDVLGEDQLLGAELGGLGLRSHVCPVPVVDVAPNRTLAGFWERHTRWSAIRFRLVRPGAYLEPLLNPTVFALAATLLAPRRAAGLALSALASVAFARAVEAPRPATYPLQQVVFFAVWLRGSTIRTVSWQGHRLRMGVRSRLSVPEGGS
jgi:ceramide glucosyltransferase